MERVYCGDAYYYRQTLFIYEQWLAEIFFIYLFIYCGDTGFFMYIDKMH